MPTPLFEAVKRGNHAEVQELLKKEVQVNIGRGPSTSHRQPMSPLYLAVIKKDLRSVQLLLKNSEIDVDKSFNGMTPLAQAFASYMHSDSGRDRYVMGLIARELRQHGANLVMAQSEYVQWCEKRGLPTGLGTADLASLKQSGPSPRAGEPPYAGALRL
tara:strand:+ start:248 stop:724 length:477 start_codon:yes stop_codon:yes gene_type:complete